MTNSYTGLDDAGVATAAARAGADVVRSLYGRRLARIDKGGGDFATAADVEAEEAILGVIRAARPDDAVLGEEGGRRGSAEAVRQWLVDPLCGTLNYAVGNMLVAVNVALRGGAAAVADPFSGEIFFTDGETARVRSEGAVTRLAPTSATRLVDVNLDSPFPGAPGFRAVDLLAQDRFAEQFRPRVVSTTLALAWVAAGKRAAYVTEAQLHGDPFLPPLVESLDQVRKMIVGSLVLAGISVAIAAVLLGLLYGDVVLPWRGGIRAPLAFAPLGTSLLLAAAGFLSVAFLLQARCAVLRIAGCGWRVRRR